MKIPSRHTPAEQLSTQAGKGKNFTTREQVEMTYTRETIWPVAKFSPGTGSQRPTDLKTLKENNCQLRILYPEQESM